MELATGITSAFLLGTIAWQDFRTRLITAWLIPACGFLLILHEATHAGLSSLCANAGWNFLLLLMQYVLLSLYVALRNGKWMRIVDSHIGTGDILFLVSVAPALSPPNFCLLITGGTVVALLVHTLIQRLFRRGDLKVPLAGYLGVILLCVTLLTEMQIIPLQLSDSEWLNSLLLTPGT